MVANVKFKNQEEIQLHLQGQKKQKSLNRIKSSINKIS
jgi:hypothetical protein